MNVLELESYRQQAMAWEKVFVSLCRVAPGWNAGDGKPKDLAVRAIETMARQAAQVGETESRLAAANALLRQCAGNVSNPLVIAIQKHFQDTAEPVAQGEADLCDCDADKYNKLPHHADCAALAAQPSAVPDEVAMKNASRYVAFREHVCTADWDEKLRIGTVFANALDGIEHPTHEQFNAAFDAALFAVAESEKSP